MLWDMRGGSVLWDGEGRESCGMVRGGRVLWDMRGGSVLWDGEGRECVMGW